MQGDFVQAVLGDIHRPFDPLAHGFPLRASHGVVDDLGGAVRGDGGRGAVGQRVQALIGFDRFALRFDYAGGGGRGRPVALRLIRGENLLVRGHRVGRTEGDPPQQHRLPLGGQRQGMLAGGQIIFQRAGRRVGRGAGGGGQPLGLFLLPGADLVAAAVEALPVHVHPAALERHFLRFGKGEGAVQQDVPQDGVSLAFDGIVEEFQRVVSFLLHGEAPGYGALVGQQKGIAGWPEKSDRFSGDAPAAV